MELPPLYLRAPNCRHVTASARSARNRLSFSVIFVASNLPAAGVAELADALDSKSSDRKIVWVRSPPPAVRAGLAALHCEIAWPAFAGRDLTSRARLLSWSPPHHGGWDSSGAECLVLLHSPEILSLNTIGGASIPALRTGK
jgi:hypothetical protein